MKPPSERKRKPETTIREVLHYRDEHGGPMVWDASTPELKAAAILGLFEYFDSLEFYQYADQDAPEDLMSDEQTRIVLESKDPDRIAAGERLRASHQRQVAEFTEERMLYEKAKAGDAKAAHRLMWDRRDSEYERWEFLQVQA